MAKLRIKDIAQLANVSIGTVDRVIHKRGEVSASTREKVQRILEEHHFEPDPIASSLAMKKALRLGLLKPGAVSGHVFWDLPHAGIQRALDELSAFDIELIQVDFDQFDRKGFSECTQHLDLEGLDGMLFAPVFQEESLDFIARCRKSEVPVVLFNSLLEAEGISSYVGQDARQSGYVGAKLISHGMEHRHDVLVINMSARRDHYSHLIAREQGFKSFFEEHSGRLDHLLSLDMHGVDDAVLFSKLDEHWERYQIGGVFVSNSRVYKVAEYLERKGIMGTRLVGYDLLPQSVEYLKRDYIDFLISQRPEEQAYKGLISLFNLLALKREPQARQLMPIDIITRENLSYYKP